MIRFTVPGNPMGYVRTTRRQLWVDPRWKRYRYYKEETRLRANQAGVPLTIKGKCFVEIIIYFPSDTRRPDSTNVLNGIIDGMFRQDRNVVGRVTDFHFDRENPRVEVTIWKEGDNV